MSRCQSCGADLRGGELLHSLTCPGPDPDFDGATYDHERDHARLTGQMKRVRDVVLDGVWRTLPEIEALTGDPTQSISARLRDLRKGKFGGFRVERRTRTSGLWEYRVRTVEQMRRSA